MAREAGMELAQRYTYEQGMDTLVCLDGSEVIGAFLARSLARKEIFAVNSSKSLNIVTPEYDSNGQLIFRDNLAPMVEDKDNLLLISTVNSGRTARRAVECVKYYGGRVRGVAAVFSVTQEVDGVPVYSLFGPGDIPGYQTWYYQDCPLCKEGRKIDGLSNSYGFSRF